MRLILAIIPIIAATAEPVRDRLPEADGVAVPSSEVAALQKAAGVAPAAVAEVGAANTAAALPPAVMAEIMAVAEANALTPAEVAEVVALARVVPLPPARLAEIYALAKAAGVGAAELQAMFAAAMAAAKVGSRFDLLDPGLFSTLWYIKQKGKAAEKRGENTDALWRDYWRVFEAAARRGR